MWGKQCTVSVGILIMNIHM